MIIRNDWCEDKLKWIAKQSGSKQAVEDVSYARFSFYHNPEKMYCEWIEGVAFIFAVKNKSGFRLIGMATSQEYKHKGIASYLLGRAINYAMREGGYSKITTRTYDGAAFYARKGFKVVGRKGKDYLMEMIL